VRFTFAVVGHDEAATMTGVLAMAIAAARRGQDDVWFVDSGSTDGSARVAAALGVEVIQAPLGKGRAIAAALGRCRDGRIVLLDADVRDAERNLALTLRQAAEAHPDADMIVGQPTEPAARGVYHHLSRALFPEVPLMRVPLSGFRVLDATRDHGSLPHDYGVEAHLNVRTAVTGGSVETCEIGAQQGADRGREHMARVAADVARGMLDLAETHGRLATGERARWDRWVDAFIAAPDRAPALVPA
jgi:hypothetical protein